MTLDDNTNKLIEEYLLGQLSPEELVQFQKRLSEDKDLRNAVELERILMNQVINDGEQALREKMRNIHNEHSKIKINKSKNIIPMSKKLFPIISVAATLLILVGAFFMFQNSDTGLDQTDGLGKYLNSKDTYTQSLVSSFGTRGGTTPAEEEKIKKLKTIFNLIGKGDYKQAKPILDSYIAEYPEDEDAKYAKAKIYLDQADYGNAIVWFMKVRKSENRELRNESEFYYGLCHFMIVDGDTEAKKVLQGVAKDNRSDWQAAAKDVLANR